MLTDVISSYVTGTYRVYRKMEGSYDSNGRYNLSGAVDDDVVSVDFAANSLEVTGHDLSDGDGPFFLTTGDTLPAPLAELTPYWVIVVDANNLQLAASYEDSLNATPVDLTDAGTGTHHVANYFLADLSIQPAGGGIKDLAEGQHTEATFTVWSTVELKSRDDGWEPDVIEYNGELHRVDAVDYFGILSRHWKATITRMATP